MNRHPDHLDYHDFEAIVQEARMQRSVAVANAIASVVSAATFGVNRAVSAVKAATSGSKSRAAAKSDSALDIPARH